MYLKFNNKNV